MERIRKIIFGIAVLLIFLFALTIRIVATDFNRPVINGSDCGAYHYAAENLLKYRVLTHDRDGFMFRGEIEVKPTPDLSIGYPLFLAVLYVVFGHSTQVPIVANIVLSMLSFTMLFLILRQIRIKPWIIVFVLLSAAVYPGFIYNLDLLLTEQLFTSLLLSSALCFVFYLQTNRLAALILTSVLLSCALHVRAIALSILLLAVFFAVLHEERDKKKLPVKLLFIAGIFVVIMLPWWIRNIRTFERFIFLTEGGKSPQIWGAVPYFIDMGSTAGKSLEEVVANNATASKAVIAKWRLFGFFQYMWYDVWDENIAHPFAFVRFFVLMQHLLIVPCVALIPTIVRRCKKESLFLICIPIVFTIMNLPFHGLARYVFPSVPFVFIVLALLLDSLCSLLSKSSKKGTIEEPRSSFHQRTGKVRMFFFAGSILFSIVLTFSVYSFSYRVNLEMSEYRVSRYANTSIKEVIKGERIQQLHFDPHTEGFRMDNAALVNEQANTYFGREDTPSLLHISIPSCLKAKKQVVSQVTIHSKGGYPFDYMTVYWFEKTGSQLSENEVYRFPINRSQSKHTVYIEGDVSGLLIVPSVFRGQAFRLDGIDITKYELK